MRNNQPVTNVEVPLDGRTLISKTDLKGLITYVNKDFVDVSGFSEAELIGQSHHIVRHPDMPAEAFADMWRDLQDGRPWSGLVKNRCKNGNFYWVQAHAAPLRENGLVVGYISLRRQAPAPQVKAAAAAYAAFREPRAGGRRICHGRVETAGVSGRIRRWLANASASKKIVLSLLFGLLLILGVAVQVLSSYIVSAFDARGRETLRHDIDLIEAMVQTNLQVMRREAVQINRGFDMNFPEGFSLEGSDEAPVLRHGKADVLNGNSEIVDRFTARTGAVATIFMRQGEDFVRITTSLKKEDGERAVGTRLSREHPAYALLLAGKPYVGQATLFGKAFFTSYTPLLSRDGKLIGASFIGLDITAELESLKNEIRSLKVGESGYYYVLDAAPGKTYGNLVVHPAKEGRNVLAAQDAAGHEFIRDMLERKSGEAIYPWMNAELGETAARDKIVVFKTLPEVQWLIAGGSYLDEFHALSAQISRYLVSAGLVLSLILLAFLSGLIRRLIVRPLQQKVIPVFASLAEGNYDNAIDITADDEVGKVLQGLQSMQIQQGFKAAEEQRIANDNLRIAIALDCVAANLRIADDDGTVIYANKGLLTTLRQIEPRLREQQPGFSVDKFIGSNIGVFYPDPAAALKNLRELQASRQAELEIGGRIYNIVTNPIINSRGQRLGTVGEWVDRTAELNAQRSVAALIGHASAGDLDARLDTDGLEGFYRELGIGINSLLATSAQAIGEIARLLERMAQGDLTQTVDSNYQGTFAYLREDANMTVARLRELVGEIQISADTISLASQEIASGNQDLSGRTEEQASSLEETASSMEELTATVRLNAENSHQAKELASEAQRIAEQGGEVVGQVVKTMGAIHQASSRIADIIGVIDGIAFQTNILALNAAVEAARAGEQGRGFAVVATEVRSLAQRSAAAAKEIKGLISDSVERVESGNRLVDQAGQTMENVVASIKRVARIVTDISAASSEQRAGIEQISVAVNQMDEVTQQNAALVEQAAAAAESLEEQARQLLVTVSVFKLVAGSRREVPRLASASPEKEHIRQVTGLRRPSAALPSSLDDEWEEF